MRETKLNSANFLPSTDNLNSFMSHISNIPILSEEEEVRLAHEHYFNDNIEAAKKLVLSHLRFVSFIANQYKGYNLPLSDLIQEGTIGLMKAVKKFDPRKGIRLVSFAVHWIKAEIHEFVVKNFRIGNVATTKAQRKLFFNLRKEKSHNGNNWITQDERKRISEKLNVSEVEIDTMEQRLFNYDHYLGIPDDDNGEDRNYFELEDHNSDHTSAFLNNQESENSTSKLKLALDILSERDKDIIQARWLNEEKAPLRELAEKYSISMERVRQIEKNALLKLKENIVN
jgi:RNA polymerase sigma-32 factor